MLAAAPFWPMQQDPWPRLFLYAYLATYTHSVDENQLALPHSVTEHWHIWSSIKPVSTVVVGAVRFTLAEKASLR